MSGLLYKNFIYFKTELIAIGVIQATVSAIILVIAVMTNAPEEVAMPRIMAYSAVFVLSTFFNTGLFSADEKRITSSFLISTPKGAKGHIQSKYYTILIVKLLILFACFVTDTVACGVVNGSCYSVLLVCVVFFGISLILDSISIPFLIRFGSNNGIGIMFLVIGIVVLAVGIYALFGDISMFFVDDVLEAIGKFFSGGNAVLIASFIPFTSILIYYLSYKLSLSLYKKGVENYEQ